MCRSRKIWFSVLAFFWATFFVEAASLCEPSEVASLNREVANIKAGYEEAEADVPQGQELTGVPVDLDTGKYSYFEVYLLNLSENFYAVISNNVDNSVYTLRHTDAVDGKLKIDWKNLSKVTTFSIKIYSTSKTGCADELYRTLNVIVPRYNEFSDYIICRDASDHNFCQKYVRYLPVDTVTFLRSVTNYIREEQAKAGGEQEQPGFIERHKIAFIIGGIVIVAAIGVAGVVIVKKRKGEEK